MAKKISLKSKVTGTSRKIIFFSNSAEETIYLGKLLSSFLLGEEIICFFGELGSGKTTFIKGIAEGLGIKKEQIISPSFVLLREFCGRKSLYHFDLYRLKEPREVFELGYEEFLYTQAISVIEWAERLNGFLPTEFLGINIKHISENKRKIEIFSVGNHYEYLIKQLSKKIKDENFRN